MNALNHIAVIVLPVMLLSSTCAEKNDNKTPNILKGRIMHNCTIPGANIELTLKPNAMYADIIYSTTDENGYFEIKYTADAQSYRLYAPYEIMSGIPAEEYLDLGEINTVGTVNFIIKLQVDNNYTENDTLFYYNRDYPHNSNIPWIKVPGPFYSGNLDTVYNAPYFGTYFYNQPNQLYTSYYVNSHLNDIQKYFDVHFCTNSFSEVVLVID